MRTFAVEIPSTEKRVWAELAPWGLLVTWAGVHYCFSFEYYGGLVCSLGYSIRNCNSVEEGIEAIRADNFSLAIVSQGSPAFEGRKVLEFSLQLRPDLPVLVIARSLNVRCYLEAMDLGASDYLERPEPRDMVWVVYTQMHRAGNVPASSKWRRNEDHIQTVRT